MNNFQSNFAPHMEGMLAYKEALGYSRSTFTCYLHIFDEFCYSRFPSQQELTRDLVSEWARCRKSESANTLKRRLSTIRQFGKYLQSIGITAYLLPSKMTGPERRYIPHLFTNLELTAFFSGSDQIPASSKDPLSCYIVPVIFRLIYCCGLRPGEPLRLRTENVDLKTGRVFIQESKRHKDRIVMLSDDLLQICRNYGEIRDAVCPGSVFFFPDKEGLSRGMQWLAYQFKKCWKLAGMSTFHGPQPRVYDFRHSFATKCLHNWLDEKQDLYFWIPYLSAYMGHGDFSSTAYYIHFLPERLTNSPTINWQSFSDLLPEVPQ